MKLRDSEMEADAGGEKPPRIAPWVKGPLLMYLTIVAAFAIIAVGVLIYVMRQIPVGSR